MLDFIERRINLSLAELATRTSDDATSTGCDPESPTLLRVGATTDPFPEPPSPTSSRASWASHPLEDDEHWDDYQKYLGHNSFFAEEKGGIGSDSTRTHPVKRGRARVRGTGGQRTTTKPNRKHRCPRRRQEQRRRRALRRKQLARRARVGGRRRRLPTCFRGGANSDVEGDQGTGEETAQVAAQVAEQETGQGLSETVHSAFFTIIPTMMPGGRAKRPRQAPIFGDELRPAHLASTQSHLHPQ
ncbi:unnamed protein product, partial [Ectocarpus sp. 12 AP-2014]